MGISDYLVKIEELTNTNIELLKALNDAFYSDKSHLSVNIEDKGNFVIPSFISLENKINALQSNFENLVDSPATGEAFFTFNGNSRAIEVRKYEQGPSPVILSEQSTFEHESNQVFKDFLTPVPYLKFDISDIPNDITSVVVRKVAAVSESAKERFVSLLQGGISKTVSWGDFYKILDDLNENSDYILYDTTKTLPIRKGQGTGSYVIKEIVREWIDENLDQHIELQFRNDIDGYQKTLSYLLFDQTIERSLSVGDYIVSWDGKVKFEIEELNFNTNTIIARICFGDYANMIGIGDQEDTTAISDMARMKFFSTDLITDLYSNDKYVKVPLEEDQYIYVSIAPLNSRMNIRAPWGDGLVVDVDKLTTDDGSVSFRDYYKNCVNIGDILNEISKVMSNTTTSHSSEELDSLTEAKPVIDTDIVKVIHINKHLDETTTIKNIRSLYAQKNEYSASLTDTQNSLTTLQYQLSSIDFEDTDGMRAKLQNQIDELTKKKNELVSSLTKICNEIALTANNSLVPIENAKYRIRGFFDFIEFANNNGIDEKSIKGILVQYRYRNIQQETGTAVTFTKDRDNSGTIEENETFIFSDWNRLATPLRPRIRVSDGKYDAEPDNSNVNTPSFNQIDIPITQGEIVDVRLKVIYDFGYPFIQMTSGWSDITRFTFPEEFLKDVSVVFIIEENNNDIETNRFNDILKDKGIDAHVGDSIMDQDVIYFHKPENISSGFFTAERRIIPLRDKLKEMNDELVRLTDEINGTTADQIQVSIDYDNSSILLSPYEKSRIILKNYGSFENETGSVIGNYDWDETTHVASIMCTIKLTNTSDHSLKIFPMFPGGNDVKLNDLKTYKFDPEEFYAADNMEGNKDTCGVWFKQPVNTDNSGGTEFKLQTTNQIITFRTKNPYDGAFYYDYTAGPEDDLLPGDKSKLEFGDEKNGLIVYPYLLKKDGLKMSFNDSVKYMLLNKGDSISIPLFVTYSFNDPSALDEYKKTISFDIRLSLYNDPITYSFTIVAPKQNNTENKLVSTLIQDQNSNKIKGDNIFVSLFRKLINR